MIVRQSVIVSVEVAAPRHLVLSNARTRTQLFRLVPRRGPLERQAPILHSGYRDALDARSITFVRVDPD